MRLAVLAALALTLAVPPYPAISDNFKVKVVATIWPLALLTREVGGDRVEVHSIVPVGFDPHVYAPKPGDLALARDCDLFITIGKEEFLGMFDGLNVSTMGWEDWVEAGLRLKGGNPHYIWLYPDNSLKVALKIAERLSKFDPDGAEYYVKRAEAFSKELNELKRWAETIVKTMGLKDSKVALAGSHLEPLYDFLNLTIVTILIRGDRTPGPRDVLNFQKAILENKPSYIAVLATQRNLEEGRLALDVSRETGIPLLYLYAFPPTSYESYVEFYRSLVSMALAGFQVENPRSGDHELSPWLYTTVVLAALLAFLALKRWLG